jgi:NAD(P)-dependent dehydrogenase (short-subunit alcohol dehydrogenase family)
MTADRGRHRAAPGRPLVVQAREPSPCIRKCRRITAQANTCPAALLDGEPIDLLINNAGIFPRESAIQNIDFDDYSRTLAVNTLGPVRVTQALLDNLRQGDKMQIVNMSSALGSIGDNDRGGSYGYRESKAALNMFTKTLATELGPDGFICLAIHPGWAATDMGGPHAPLTPAQSVAGMKAVIDGREATDNGRYRSYTGELVAW